MRVDQRDLRGADLEGFPPRPKTVVQADTERIRERTRRLLEDEPAWRAGYRDYIEAMLRMARGPWI